MTASQVWTCRCCGHHRVELVVLDRGRGPEALLKVSKRGYLVAYCRTPAEVAKHVAIGELVEVEPG